MVLRFVLLWLSVCLAGCLDLQDLVTLQQEQLNNPQIIFEQDFTPNLEKQNPGLTTLMFYTPWNPKGKKLIQEYAKKLNYVVPCWYELNLDRRSEIVVEHQSNYDGAYLAKLKSENPSIKVLPRLYLPGDRFSVLQALSTKHNYDSVMSKITQILGKKHIDGLVWDTPYNLFSKRQDAQSLNQFISGMIADIVSRNKDKLVFVNMAHPTAETDPQVIRNLKAHGVMIQNYGEGGSFLGCIDETNRFLDKVKLKNKLVVIMLPLFTVTQTGGQISTKDALKQLQDKGVEASQYNQEIGICQFSVSRNKLWVPCYNYFRRAFAKIGTNIVGFWEGGNGLDVYYSFI